MNHYFSFLFTNLLVFANNINIFWLVLIKLSGGNLFTRLWPLCFRITNFNGWTGTLVLKFVNSFFLNIQKYILSILKSGYGSILCVYTEKMLIFLWFGWYVWPFIVSSCFELNFFFLLKPQKHGRSKKKIKKKFF